MKLKTIITELVVLVVVFISTWIVLFWLTGGHHTFNPALNMGLYDIYSGLPWLTIVAYPFLMLITIIYFIKEGVYRYRRKFQNIILIAVNFLFIVLLYKFFSVTSLLIEDKGTIYPPLSALPKENKPYRDISVINHAEQILLFILIIFMLILVTSAILTGRNWKIKPHELKA